MWVTLILMLVSYFLQKRDTPEQRKKAALVAAGVGAASYYVTHETEWGRENLGEYDGVDFTSGDTGTKDGVSVPSTNGSGFGSTVGTLGSQLIDTSGNVLKSWGGTGTAAVIGTDNLTSSSSLSKYMPWLLVGAAAFILLK